MSSSINNPVNSDSIFGAQYADVHSLLQLLAEQLEVCMDTSSRDFGTIADHCLSSIAEYSEPGLSEKETLIKALQFYDRNYQCAEHIVASLRHLARAINEENYENIHIDFTQEVKKIYSLFNFDQAEKICQHIHHNDEKSEESLLSNHWMKPSKEGDSGDVEFF